MATMNGVDGEYRASLFHAIRDLTADAYGGWKAVTNVQAGGGLYAQRIVTRRYYDLEGAKEKSVARRGHQGRGLKQRRTEIDDASLFLSHSTQHQRNREGMS